MSGQCNDSPQKNVVDLPAAKPEVDKILSQIGNAPSCSTAAFHAEASAPFLHAQASGSLTTGCEQISAMVDAQVHALKDIKCLLRKRAADMSSVITSNSEITISNGKTGRISCGGESGTGSLVVKNLQNLKLNLKNNLDSQDVEKIKKDLTKVVQTTLKATQESTSGFGATPQGSKSYLTASKEVDELINNTDIVTDTVTANLAVQSGNKIKIKNQGIIEGSGCNITNETILDITAINIINAVTDKAMDIKEVKSFITEAETYQKAENAGIPVSNKWAAAFAAIGLLGLVLVGFYFYRQSQKKKRQTRIKLQGYKRSKLKQAATNLSTAAENVAGAATRVATAARPYYNF